MNMGRLVAECENASSSHPGVLALISMLARSSIISQETISTYDDTSRRNLNITPECFALFAYSIYFCLFLRKHKTLCGVSFKIKFKRVGT